MQQNEPAWLTEARKYLGLHEIEGEIHHPDIVQFWKDIRRGGIRDDETPWCAAFTGAVLERCGIVSTRFESAASYLSWGVHLRIPVRGCVVVLRRRGGGHVGFVIGKDTAGRLLVLGGNQSDAVSIRAFSTADVLSYRWPHDVAVPAEDLPVLQGTLAGKLN